MIHRKKWVLTAEMSKYIKRIESSVIDGGGDEVPCDDRAEAADVAERRSGASSEDSSGSGVKEWKKKGFCSEKGPEGATVNLGGGLAKAAERGGAPAAAEQTGATEV